MISKKEVEALAELARLTLKKGEAEALGKDISSILEYVGQVSAFSGNAAQTSAVVRNVLRDDTPRTDEDPFSGKREALVDAFPRREGDYNVVRKIIEK